MLGVLPGIIGTIQAIETIKLILGIGKTLIGRLLMYDASRWPFASFAYGAILPVHCAGRTLASVNSSITSNSAVYPLVQLGSSANHGIA